MLQVLLRKHLGHTELHALSDMHPLWARYFHLNAVETRQRLFDHRILTDGRKIEEVVEEILGRLQEHGFEEPRGRDEALA